MLPVPLEDVLNFFMTIGSPSLAAYSLQITHLNARWLSKSFLDLRYPNSKSISTVISAFQHVPIRISSDPSLLASLIVLPQNDGYWEVLLRGVEKTRRWSIPLAMNFVWVVFAVLLTVIDSFHAPHPGDVGYCHCRYLDLPPSSHRRVVACWVSTRTEPPEGLPGGGKSVGLGSHR
jgi:hypothetical protein